MNLELKMAPVQEAVATSPPCLPANRDWKSLGFQVKQTLGQLAMFSSLSVACYFLFSHFFLESVQIKGNSMVPTLQDGDQYVLNRWAYIYRAPQRGDVVVIKDPEDNCFAVKRIIATSGETVLFKDGEVYVNNEKLSEPYLTAGTKTPTYSPIREQLIGVGTDRYFVLGDNRKISADSRVYGSIPRKNILGLIPR